MQIDGGESTHTQPRFAAALRGLLPRARFVSALKLNKNADNQSNPVARTDAPSRRDRLTGDVFKGGTRAGPDLRRSHTRSAIDLRQ